MIGALGLTVWCMHAVQVDVGLTYTDDESEVEYADVSFEMLVPRITPIIMHVVFCTPCMMYSAQNRACCIV